MTRVITTSDPTRGTWKETLHGTASYRRPSVFPLEAEQIIPIPYAIVSGSVNWDVTGFVQNGPCVTTFSGSGTHGAMLNDALGATDLWLQDVTPWWTKPVPEPQPYYFSIRGNGDPLTAPLFDLDSVGDPSCRRTVRNRSSPTTWTSASARTSSRSRPPTCRRS